MKQNGTAGAPGSLGEFSIWKCLRTEWPIWLGGALLSVVIACRLISWKFLPSFDAPYGYGGDILSHVWFIKRLIEGWLYDNPRSGYPFGSNFLDYPNSDFSNLALLKILALFTKKYYAIFNAYVLLAFAAIFVAAYGVLRRLGLYRSTAFVAAMLFDYLPFHIARIPHLFLTWYAVAPVYIAIGFSLYGNGGSPAAFSSRRWWWTALQVVGLLLLASFGFYYTVFGLITIAFSAAAGAARTRSRQPLLKGGLVAAVLCVGVLANVAPHLWHVQRHGVDQEVAARPPMEGEILGFKPIQLVLPEDHYRLPSVARWKQNYDDTFPMVNENSTSSLGLAGSIGLVAAGGILVWSLWGGGAGIELGFLSLLVCVYLVFGTFGGAGAGVSQIMPLLRGWNRISVFLGFAALGVAFLLYQKWVLERYRRHTALGIAGLGLILVFALADQTTPYYGAINRADKVSFERDRVFIRQVENHLPKGSAIYQLPYMRFPEAAPLHELSAYALAVGFLNSDSLKWNFAGMAGREGDLFYKALSHEPIDRQLEIVRKLGFAGVYLDRRGYADRGVATVAALTALLGPPVLARSDDQAVFFDLHDHADVDFSGLAAQQIMRKVGFYLDGLGVRYQATPAAGIDFSRAGWPDFIKAVSGIDANEPWGRWSLGKEVDLTFFDPLPQRFELELVLTPSAPNVGKDLAIKIGSRTYEMNVPAADYHVSLPVDLHGEKVDEIRFVPAVVASPKELGLNQDDRKIGIGLIHLSIQAK